MKILLPVILLLISLTACGTPGAKTVSKTPPRGSGSKASASGSTRSKKSPPSHKDDGDVLEISEKMFLTQINDIYCNFDSYKDKTIIVEGMFTRFDSADGSRSVPVVYRKGPGCCGNDGWGGFLLKYDGEFPGENAWIRVTGTPELIKEGNSTDLYLEVTSLKVKTKRGAEFVSQ
ncbi:MAG: hypothetical protein ACOX4I_07380 [Anaerovoracaceae bacterium]